MYKLKLVGLFLLLVFSVYGQENSSYGQTKKIIYSKNPIQLDSVNLLSESIILKTKSNQIIDTSFYKWSSLKQELTFKKEIFDTIEVSYQRLPNFLTKTYQFYSDKKVVPNQKGSLLTFDEKKNSLNQPLFEGLQSSGSISRAITIGNNQNTVLNSNLDLQLSGNISKDVVLKASIQDSNIPLQEGGYSQKIDEFDQVFVELSSKNWAVRAGDLFLENRTTSFLNFNKKVQGLQANYFWNKGSNKTNVFAGASIVRGQYDKSSFTAQEGNQGPYKLKGSNGELYVLIISGSERVYINGILQERGENKDYVIDYNAGELIFNSTKPITSEMRIVVEYQYSERNFTRFLTYGGVTHEREKWKLGTYFYSENDVKNQPLQQNLSQQQIQVLQNAGDSLDLMFSESAYIDSYSENKILYKKVSLGSSYYYEYSNDNTLELYNVKFTFVGENIGNYILQSSNAIGKVFQYVAPVSGVPQGNYEPIIKLIAPSKLQIFDIVSEIDFSEKSKMNSEIAVSNNDKNLYSTIDDSNNKGIAFKNKFNQVFNFNNLKLDVYNHLNYVQENYKPVERIFNIEFNRDWNILNPKGNQLIIASGVNFSNIKRDSSKVNFSGNYQWEKLNYSVNFKGNKHGLSTQILYKNVILKSNSSIMKSNNNESNTLFIRNQNILKYHFKKNYAGGTTRFEDFQEKDKQIGIKPISQRFLEYGNFIGRGDTTKVFIELGYLIRNNDSVVDNLLQKVNRSMSTYLKSQILKTENQNLSLFFNYRYLKYFDTRTGQPSLNTRLLYNGTFFNQLLLTNTSYEALSGTIAQQEYTFLEVEPGRGVFMWNDYNGNQIQELEEFEIANFPDLAKYVKVFLPNQIFVQTFQNKFNQNIIFNGAVWTNKSGFLKTLSKFYNQITCTIDKKVKRNSFSIDFNPFTFQDDELLGLNQSIRNSLFFNKGKQRMTFVYNYTYNTIKSLLSFGTQENNLIAHQLQWSHLVKKYWLFQNSFGFHVNKTNSENYESRNFKVITKEIYPKISYLFSKNASLELNYKWVYKENILLNNEQLNQDQIGLEFIWNTEKAFTSSGNFRYIKNNFEGNASSPVGFQMLEGLQPGKNLTWMLTLQKNLTKYLDLSLNYQGRKSETSKTVHIGTVQLRAFF